MVNDYGTPIVKVYGNERQENRLVTDYSRPAINEDYKKFPDINQITTEQRTFNPQPDWNPIEKNYQGKVTVYEDSNGVRHYTPDSTMWKAGFKDSREFAGGRTVITDESGNRIAINLPANETSNAPYIDIAGRHYTRAEIEKLNALEGQDLLDAMEQLGILPKGNEYVSGTKTILYRTPEEIQRQTSLNKALFEYRKAQRELSIYEKASPEQKFIILMKRGEVPKGSVFKGIDSEGYISFVSPQSVRQMEVKDRLKSEALAELAKGGYVLPDGYNISKYLRDNPDREKILLDAGFNDEDILDAKITNRALEKLKDYQDKENADSFDIAKYLRMNPDDKQALKEAGFDDSEIKKAEDFNNEKMTLNNYIDLYFSDRGWELDRNKLVRDLNRKYGSADTPEARPTLQKWEDRINEAKKTYNEKYGGIAKETLMTGAENLVPYVSTARNWSHLETRDKIIGLSIDTAVTITMIWGGRILGSAAKAARLTETSALERAAIKAGEAGRVLNIATKNYEKSLAEDMIVRKGIKVPASTEDFVKLANKVESARAKSMAADNAFLKQLSNTEKISYRELKQIEKKAGIKNLNKAIKEVNNTRAEVQKAWKEVDKWGKNLKTELNKSNYLVKLQELQNKQIRLQSALERANSILKPRYSPKEPPAEFKGWKFKWGKDVKLDGNPDLFKDIDGYLARNGEIAEGKAGVKPWELSKEERIKLKEREAAPKEKGKYTMAVKPEYKAVPKEATKIEKIPKVARKSSSLPGIRTKTKTEYSPREGMQTQEYRRNINKNIDKILSEQNIKLSDKEWQQVSDATMAKIAQATMVSTKEGPISDFKINEIIKENLKPFIGGKLAPAPQTATRSAIKNLTELKQEPKEPPPKEIFTDKGRGGFKIPPGRGGTNEKAKRQFLDTREGFTARRRGELNGKPLWLVDFYPYKDGDNMVLLGLMPEGAKPISGPGSLKESAYGRGKLPDRPLYRDTGAVDDIIRARGRKILVDSVQDKRL